MQKIACIFSFKMSSWVSCQKIVFNLHKAYQKNSDVELINFNFSANQTATELQEMAEKISSLKPDALVILDHKPHPLELFSYLLPLLNKKTKIFFHVFGDFTLYYEQWGKLALLLKDFPVEFITASQRQKVLIDKLLPQTSLCSVCPFPVHEDEFNFNISHRKNQRADWGLTEKDIVFVSTGRLSSQKRTLTLLRGFSEFLENSKATNAYLFIYGSPDSLGDQFVGKWEAENEYFRRLNRFYKDLPKKIQAKIHFMGGVPNQELRFVYPGADYLINLSVHNDEDFGMSVAEAQCSGLPSIVTDWGGLAGFGHPELPEATRFIQVRIGKRSKKIHYQDFLRAINSSYSHGHFSNRNEISNLALKKFGIKACGETLKKISNKKLTAFTGFSHLFDEVLLAQKAHSQTYLINGKITKLYRELYSSYERNN